MIRWKKSNNDRRTARARAAKRQARRWPRQAPHGDWLRRDGDRYFYLGHAADGHRHRRRAAGVLKTLKKN